MLGIIVTAAAPLIMPVLAWLKLRTARELGSRALRADAFEAITCAGLSATTLAGVALNLALGWTWADPLAALVLMPVITREGFEAIGISGDHEEHD